MKIIDEMLHLALLPADQHRQISAWMVHASSPDDILKMPAPLWRAAPNVDKKANLRGRA